MALTRPSQSMLGIISGSSKKKSYLTEAEALAETGTPTDTIEIMGRNVVGDYGGYHWIGKKVASAPAHQNYRTQANGQIYDRVPAAPLVPASVCELGLLPNQGPSVDCTPALNKVFTAALQGPCKVWAFPDAPNSTPVQEYWFNSKPDAMPPMTLRGPGVKNDLSLFKNFVSASDQDGIFNIHISGTFLSDVRIVGVSGSQNASTYAGTGCAISVVSNVSDGAIGYGGLENIEVTSDASLPNGHACLAYDVYLEGKATSLVGVRAIPMRNLKLFGAEKGSLFCGGGVGFLIDGPGTYGAGGLTGALMLNGGQSGKTADGSSITFGEVFGGATIDWHNGLILSAGHWAGGDISISANCSDITIIGGMSFIGSITNNCPSAHIVSQL